MSRYQPDHYDVCDTIKLECGLEFCPDHDEQPAYGPNPEDFDPRFPSYLHDRGLCAECDSCWVDVDANLAYERSVSPHPHVCRCNACQHDAMTELAAQA